MHSQMALDSNGWLAHDEHKPNGNEPESIYITREQSHPASSLIEISSKPILAPTEHRYVSDTLFRA